MAPAGRQPTRRVRTACGGIADSRSPTVGRCLQPVAVVADVPTSRDRKSTRLNSSHANISYAVFCLKKKRQIPVQTTSNLVNLAHVAAISYGLLGLLGWANHHANIAALIHDA